MKKKLLLGTAIIAVAMLAAAIYYKNIAEVEAIKVQTGTITQTVEETGYIRSSNGFDIQAPSGGRIISLQVQNGQMVKAGQVMAVMQNLDLEGQLAAINASAAGARSETDTLHSQIETTRLDLIEARRDQQRKNTLLQAGSISQADYDTVASKVSNLEQSLKSLNESLTSLTERQNDLQDQQKTMSRQVQDLVITSPIDGKVLAMDLKMGQMISAGTVVASVGTPGELEAYTEILCNEVLNVRAGQKANITFTGQKGIVLPGRVKEVYPQATEKISALGVAQRRVPVIITLEKSGPLQPGYEVQVVINTSTHRNILLLPRETVNTSSQGADYVKLIISNRIVTRQVKAGLKNSSTVEVVQGLQKGDIVLRDGSSDIKDGTRVKIKK